MGAMYEVWPLPLLLLWREIRGLGTLLRVRHSDNMLTVESWNFAIFLTRPLVETVEHDNCVSG